MALPDLTGRVALITGGSGGLGIEIVRGLASAGAVAHRLLQRIGNTPRQAARPALMAASAGAAGASAFGPAGFGHTRGPAAPQRMYRRIADPADGIRAWDLGTRLASLANDADTMP